MRRTTNAAAIIAAALLVGACGTTEGIRMTGESHRTAMEADREAIRRLIEASNEHQNDPERYGALLTSEVAIVNIAGRRVLGREEIVRAVRQAVSGPLARVLTRIELVDIRFLRPDVALASGIKHVSDERRPGEVEASLPTKGSVTFTVVKEGTEWKIASSQTTPIR
ncbi:SgcJ/EcaC family oxidoreductase [Vulgatibacter sp.]|uniref:SgcJ/EcaC family oxidoreductase n=1 Tax=Vulgatibacter sp. TaxID=1971226 RepID=UPI00356B0A9B